MASVEGKVSVEAVTEPVTIGEGPHWDHAAQALYFVSILDRTIHKYVPATGRHTRAELDNMPSFIIPIAGRRRRFAIGLNREVVDVEWDGEGEATVKRVLAEVDQDKPKNRFNDGKADPRGRLFAGTLGDMYEPGKIELKKGSLYRIDPDGSTHKLVSDVTLSNGLYWDVKERAFYYADSFEHTIRRFDYDIETGNISNPRHIFRCSDHGLTGILDGMTIDTDGNLWVANFEGQQMLKIDPRTSKLLEKIPIPALQVTSATFGGPKFDELYVTTACMDHGEKQLPPAGSTFRLTETGAKGQINVYAKFN